jgi:serine protease inhibitor
VDAFGPADFSRMVQGGGIWVDRVVQKTFVRVDEEGTEAAAVTIVVMVESAPPEFVFDQPFLFAIRERLSGTVLFIGVIGDPAG